MLILLADQNLQSLKNNDSVKFLERVIIYENEPCMEGSRFLTLQI